MLLSSNSFKCPKVFTSSLITFNPYHLSRMAHSNTQNFQKQTFVFKKVGSLELSLDVVTKTSATPSAALIHYHGGFLVRFNGLYLCPIG